MVRNAVIMAAGFSSRFVPLSWEKPKGLLDVKGEVLIERQIRQLKEAGIEEIIVVTGYKAELFQYLEEKYGVILVHNPYFETRNNHTSLYVAREYLKNTYICCADNYYLSNIFVEESTKSYYSSIYIDGPTDEWCLTLDVNDKIEKVEVGGKDSYIMIGPAFFDQEFSKEFRVLLEEIMADETKKDDYWEDIYLDNMDKLNLFARKFDESSIEEFDSLEDLRKFDNRYLNDTKSEILEKIAQEKGVKQSAITGIKPIKKEGKVVGFNYTIGEKDLSYYL